MSVVGWCSILERLMFTLYRWRTTERSVHQEIMILDTVHLDSWIGASSTSSGTASWLRGEADAITPRSDRWCPFGEAFTKTREGLGATGCEL